jgi:hypothetical protein
VVLPRASVTLLGLLQVTGLEQLESKLALVVIVASPRARFGALSACSG